MDLFDTALIDRSHYSSNRTYQAAIYAMECMNRVIEFHNKGYGILFEGAWVVPSFKFDPEDGGMCWAHSKTCTLSFVGDCHEGPNYEFIYVTKKQMKEFFSDFVVVERKHMKKVT